jgi:hypothetical protein
VVLLSRPARYADRPLAIRNGSWKRERTSIARNKNELIRFRLHVAAMCRIELKKMGGGENKEAT